MSQLKGDGQMNVRTSMTRVTRWAATAAMGLLFLAAPARAFAQNATGSVVQVKAKGSVDQVVDKIKKMVASNGMMVMGELHQGKVIGMTGLSLESESIFVGNPQVGKEAFGADAGVGVALPVRLNVFKNAQGATIVTYVPPSEILKNLHNAKVDEVAKMLD